MILTMEWMKEFNIEDDNIKFIVRNNLLGLNLNKLCLIFGDYQYFKHNFTNRLDIEGIKINNSFKTYDLNNNLLAYNDPESGYWKNVTYDLKGNLLSVNDSKGYFTIYTYNDRDDVLTRNEYYKTNKLYSTINAYNLKGNITSTNHFNFNDKDDKDDNFREHTWVNYTYDSNGNISLIQECNDYKKEFTYDDRGNILTSKKSDKSAIYKYLVSTYDNDNNLLTEDNYLLTEEDKIDSYYTEYSYDDRGNILTYKRKFNDQQLTYDRNTYEYLNGRLHKIYSNDKLILEIPVECFEV